MAATHKISLDAGKGRFESGKISQRFSDCVSWLVLSLSGVVDVREA